jgi:hypothetical protein
MLRLLGWFVEEARSLPQYASAELVNKFGGELDNLASTVDWAITMEHAETVVAAAWALVGFRSVYRGSNRHAELRTLGLALLDHLQQSEGYDGVGIREIDAVYIAGVAPIERHARAWRALLLASQKKHVRSILKDIVASPTSETLTAHSRKLYDTEVQTVFDEIGCRQ